MLASYRRLQRPPGGWHLVVIDNGSDDGSLAIARSFADSLPLVTLSEPRRGKNRALNTGLRALEGDLAVFSDDDGLPERGLAGPAARAPRTVTPTTRVFGGPSCRSGSRRRTTGSSQWVRLAPVFSVTDAAREEGPCEPTQVWGANMAIRAELFRKGHRFDERLGPDGSATYAMGGETELTLRLAIARACGAGIARTHASPHDPATAHDAPVDPQARVPSRPLCLPGVAAERGGGPSPRAARGDRRSAPTRPRDRRARTRQGGRECAAGLRDQVAAESLARLSVRGSGAPWLGCGPSVADARARDGPR